MLIAFVFYCAVSILKHIHFYSTAYDLSIFDQAVRAYSEFRSPESALRGYDNLLGDHFHPILALLAPFYWIANSPVTLLVAQAALVCSTAIPIYLFGLRQLKKQSWALMVAILFLANAAIMRMVRFDFHEIAFALPAIAWGIYAVYQKKWWVYWLSVVILLLTKEDQAFVVVGFGLLLFVLREWKRAIGTVVVGITSFLAITKIFVPYFAGGQGGGYGYWSYTSLGDNLGGGR